MPAATTLPMITCSIASSAIPARSTPARIARAPSSGAVSPASDPRKPRSACGRGYEVGVGHAGDYAPADPPSQLDAGAGLLEADGTLFAIIGSSIGGWVGGSSAPRSAS